MTLTYRTSVLHLPETPLGLLPEAWKVEHRCTACHRPVEPDQLISHAREHEREVVAGT
ncbi:MAG: hypothetical protein ACRETZ_18050 [Steroidobacteraceae bacterium]